MVSGPMAVVLGLAVAVLWHELKRERKEKDKLNREMVKLVRDLTASVNGESDGK